MLFFGGGLLHNHASMMFDSLLVSYSLPIIVTKIQRSSVDFWVGLMAVEFINYLKLSMTAISTSFISK